MFYELTVGSVWWKACWQWKTTACDFNSHEATGQSSSLLPTERADCMHWHTWILDSLLQSLVIRVIRTIVVIWPSLHFHPITDGRCGRCLAIALSASSGSVSKSVGLSWDCGTDYCSKTKIFIFPRQFIALVNVNRRLKVTILHIHRTCDSTMTWWSCNCKLFTREAGHGPHGCLLLNNFHCTQQFFFFSFF